MARVDDGGNKTRQERTKRRKKTPREWAAEVAASDASAQRTVGMNAALRLLSIRGRSRQELKQALTRRGVSLPVIEVVLDRLRELGYLDDTKFAKDRALSLLRNGKFGDRAVLQRLRNHGLSETEAKRALAEAEEELGFDPDAAARAVLERRGLAGRPLTLKEKGKAARLLQSRGFSAAVVGRLVGDAAFAPENED